MRAFFHLALHAFDLVLQGPLCTVAIYQIRLCCCGVYKCPPPWDLTVNVGVSSVCSLSLCAVTTLCVCDMNNLLANTTQVMYIAL